MDAQPSKLALPDRAAALALLCGLLAATSAFAQGAFAQMRPNSTLAEIAAYSGPDRIAKLIAGAKKEGVVNVYTSETVEDIGALSQAFEAKYGVKLKLWRGSSEDILQRAVVEARGGRFDADAFETGATAMESLHREQLAATGRFAGGRRSGARGDPAAPRMDRHALQHLRRRL